MSMINHRRSVVVLALVLVIPSLACSLGGGASAPEPVGVLPTVEQGTVISATSSIPTATPLPTTGGRMLPSGTLIVTQLGNTLAQMPGTGGPNPTPTTV